MKGTLLLSIECITWLLKFFILSQKPLPMLEWHVPSTVYHCAQNSQRKYKLSLEPKIANESLLVWINASLCCRKPAYSYLNNFTKQEAAIDHGLNIIVTQYNFVSTLRVTEISYVYSSYQHEKARVFLLAEISEMAEIAEITSGGSGKLKRKGFRRLAPVSGDVFLGTSIHCLC